MRAWHNRGARTTAASGFGAAFPSIGARIAPFLLVISLGSCGAPVLRARPADAAAAAEEATRSGDWPRAAELWHDVHLAKGGSEVRPYYETARALLHTGDRDSAVAMLERGLLVFPDHPDLLELRARAQAESGFRRAAEESLARVLAQDPERVSALAALARIRMQLGREQAALEPLRKIVALTGGDADTFKLLAEALRQTGQPVEAFAAYREAVHRGASSHTLLLHGAQLAVDPRVRDQHPDATGLAFAWIDRVLAEDPQATRAHFVRGLVCEDLGRGEDAVACYRRAIELDLTSLEAITNLALIYAARGDVEHTLEMVDRALELEQSPGRRAALQRLIEHAQRCSQEASEPDGTLADRER